MDAGVIDTINHRDVELITARLDKIDVDMEARFGTPGTPWYHGNFAKTIMGENDATDADRAWLVGLLAHGTWGALHFSDGPAGEDWENFYLHFRAAITARRNRDPETPSVQARSLCGMV